MVTVGVGGAVQAGPAAARSAAPSARWSAQRRERAGAARDRCGDGAIVERMRSSTLSNGSGSESGDHRSAAPGRDGSPGRPACAPRSPATADRAREAAWCRRDARRCGAGRGATCGRSGERARVRRAAMATCAAEQRLGALSTTAGSSPRAPARCCDARRDGARVSPRPTARPRWWTEWTPLSSAKHGDEEDRGRGRAPRRGRAPDRRAASADEPRPTSSGHGGATGAAGAG